MGARPPRKRKWKKEKKSEATVVGTVIVTFKKTGSIWRGHRDYFPRPRAVRIGQPIRSFRVELGCGAARRGADWHRRAAPRRLASLFIFGRRPLPLLRSDTATGKRSTDDRGRRTRAASRADAGSAAAPQMPDGRVHVEGGSAEAEAHPPAEGKRDATVNVRMAARCTKKPSRPKTGRELQRASGANRGGRGERDRNANARLRETTTTAGRAARGLAQRRDATVQREEGEAIGEASKRGRRVVSNCALCGSAGGGVAPRLPFERIGR